MNITSEKEGTNLTVYLDGGLDYPSAKQLEEYLSDKFAKTGSMVFDFEKVEYTSSAGIRVLLKTELIMKGRGGLKIKKANESVKNVLAITGFDKILTMID